MHTDAADAGAPSSLPDVEGFDRRTFEQLLERLRRGELAPSSGAQESAEPARPGDVAALPAPGTAAHATVRRLGEQELKEGRAACVIVAGGAGTRFGGAVKALVPFLGERTFLDLKLEAGLR